MMPLTRREWLSRMGMGFGSLGLIDLLSREGSLAAEPPSPLTPNAPHFAAKAKRVIHCFRNGGPSHVDTFDPKPDARTSTPASHCRRPNLRTERKTGAAFPSPFKFRRYGQSGIRGQRAVPAPGASMSTTCASSARCTPTCPITSRRCCS